MKKNDTVRLGIIGLGQRTETLLVSLFATPGVKVSGLCDLAPAAIERISEIFARNGRRPPPAYRDHRELLRCPEIDAVLIPTSWNSHLSIAADAMRAGKYAAIEVGGASSLEELWQLLHASEQTGTPCMMLENCCYGRVELLVLNMVRQGVFGELIHCTGGYEHDLGSDLAAGVANGFERSLHNLRRNGDLYPTHALGPLAKILGINRGNRFLSLTSTASKARGFQLRAREQAAERDFNAGDVVTTVIKCANGETIMLTHSVSLPRPYSRDGRVQGTKGIWCEDTNGIYIEGVSSSIVEIDPAGNPYATHKWDPVERFYDSYEHPLWREYAKNTVGGHGGMDWLALQAFLDAVRRGAPTPIDVYDCAVWMSVTCLSEQSIAMGSMPVAFPDFTNGKWIRRTPPEPSRWALDDVYPACFADFG